MEDNRALMVFALHTGPLRRWYSLSPALLLGLALALAPARASAAAADVSPPPSSANELLREAIAKEKLTLGDGYLAWIDRVQKPRGAVTKLMVNTPQGILARVVAIDDHPLSSEERQKDDERINRLLDPAKMKDKYKKQQEDREHVEHLVYVLPDAFQCEYATASSHPSTPTAGTPGSPAAEGTVLLECSPNPAFAPPNYESQLLLGMKTEITIDRAEKRITRIVGTLFRDVTFGWGFLARLKSGGRVEIAQSKVAGKHWGLTRLHLNFDGHLVMVKPMHIEETKTCSNYRPVPSMTVEQALEFLRSSPMTASK